MKNRFLLGAAITLVSAGFAFAAPAGKSGTWTGVVGETHCGATPSRPPAAAPRLARPSPLPPPPPVGLPKGRRSVPIDVGRILKEGEF